MCRDDDEGLGDDDDLSVLPQMQCVDKVVAVMQKPIPGLRRCLIKISLKAL